MNLRKNAEDGEQVEGTMKEEEARDLYIFVNPKPAQK
jgi:hypothetical protein